MAGPYDWTDDERAPRYDRREEEARRAAERQAGQDRPWSGERARQGGDYTHPDYERRDSRLRDDQRRDYARRDAGDRADDRGDFGAGWYGEDAFYEGYGAPGPYGRRSEQRGDPEPRHEHRSFEDEAREAGRKLGRGWRRMKEGMRHTFEDDRGSAEHDPRRGGGMFGGQDRSRSLFSHDDGLGATSRRLGPHRGKGPRGYVRSDERILDEISDVLTEDDRLDASGIEIRVEAGEVTLNGEVKRREDKRRAEDLAEGVSGVKHLQNNLRVRPPEPPAQPAAAVAPQTSAPAPTSAQITDQRSAAASTPTAAPKAPPPTRPN